MKQALSAIAAAALLAAILGADTPATPTTPAPAKPAPAKPAPTKPAPSPSPAPTPAAPGSGTGVNSTSANFDFNGPTHPVPLPSYYAIVNAIRDGDYKDALEGCKTTRSLTMKTAGGQWIDSICFFAISGESHYRLGQLTEALDDYNAALKLYLAFPNWMMQIQFPTVIQPQSIPPVPWGQTARPTKAGRFPSAMGFITDRVLLDPVPTGSGPPNYIAPWSGLSVNTQEIARCTALALKRRHELMGPLCAQDPLSQNLTGLFLRRPAGLNACGLAWLDVEAGMAYFGTGQNTRAVDLLKRSLTLPGGIDHPLTPLALLALGQLALESGDYKSAGKYFEEASYSAVAFDDMEVLEEAFRYGQQTRLMTNRNGGDGFPPLAPAIPWSMTHGHQLHATLLLSAAENNALANRTSPGAAALAEARSEITRHAMAAGQIGARLNYLSAMVAYQQGQVADGDRAVAEALAFEKNGSRWLFQITLADRFAAGRADSPLVRKRALPLFDSLLRDPTDADWASDPLEALSVLATPHPLAYERWFEMARQDSAELGLEVADRARRQRFYGTLPLGGRLMALRWVLEAPLDKIDPDAQLQRQDLLTCYPRYGELAKQAGKLHDELQAVPLAAVGADAQRVQADKLVELGRVSAEQETLLREMAVRRESAELAFPPQRKTKDVQAALLPRQLVLAFFSTHDATYAWLMSRNRCAAWKIQSTSAALEKQVATLLRDIGNVDANRELTPNQLADQSWRGPARDALDALTAGTKVNLAANIDELIVVPDGVLWYLPFDALEVGKDKQAKETISLLAKCRVRYLPTMGLAVPDRQERRGLGEVGVVLGNLHPHDDPQVAAAAMASLGKIAPHVSAIGRPLPAASPLYGSLFDTLVLFDDLAVSDRAAAIGDRSPYYEWSPIQLDRARGAGSLAEWFSLPRKSATQVFLPGFHTPAESGLRQMGSGPPGSDLFLSVCGLMSTGARTVLISRWRTGGQTSGELIGQFAEELPYSSASDAWQRSVQLLWETPLDLEREPRIKRTAAAEGTTGRHPLFWSGYMLVDTGWLPTKPDQLAVGPQNGAAQ